MLCKLLPSCNKFKFCLLKLFGIFFAIILIIGLLLSADVKPMHMKGLLCTSLFQGRHNSFQIIYSVVELRGWILQLILFFLTYSCAIRSNPPISLHLPLWQKHLRVSYACWPQISPAVSIWSLYPMSHSAYLYSHYLPCLLSALLLEIEALVSLTLIIRESHFHKTQNQFRKLTLEISFL